MSCLPDTTFFAVGCGLGIELSETTLSFRTFKLDVVVDLVSLLTKGGSSLGFVAGVTLCNEAFVGDASVDDMLEFKGFDVEVLFFGDDKACPRMRAFSNDEVRLSS